MPRSRRLRSLANCLRTLGLLAVLLACATALAWRYGGERIDAFERDLQSWLRAPVERALASARNQSDPDRRAASYADLLAQLSDTQREDRDAEVVRECHEQLADLALARGDVTSATDWLRARHEFDDRDLHAAVRYSELLCRTAATTATGRTMLRELAARFPANPMVVTAFVRQSMADGNPHHARAALAAAARAPRANLWTAQRANGAAIELVPTRSAIELALRLRLEPPHRQLRVVAPQNGDDYREPRLLLGNGDAQLELTATQQGQAFAFDLTDLPATTLDVTFQVRVSPRRPRWLARLLLSLGGEIKAVCRSQSASSTIASHPMPTELAGAEYDFDVVVSLGQPADVVEIELPGRDGFGYRLDLVELGIDGRTIAVTAMDEGRHFEVACPPGSAPDSIRIAGVIR